MKYLILQFKQNNNKLFSTVLPFGVIYPKSQVLVYGEDEGGYQRVPEPNHFNKIKKYAKEDRNFIFPTSIILGIDEDKFKDVLFTDNDRSFLNFDQLSDSKLFRVIDGQHRLRGLFELSKENDEINYLKLSVVVLITPQNKRSIEMKIFNTINSKSKRIKVDLIELAQFDYRILEGKIELSQTNSHISIQIAKLLNESTKENNKWLNAIKFGIHDNDKIGIIGVNAFKESIKSIVDSYLQNHEGYKKLNGIELIDFTRNASKEIANFLLKAWEVVYEKWTSCFNEITQDVDSFDEIRQFYYNTDFYIQKTLGTTAINRFLSRIIAKNERRFDNDTLDHFKSIIERSEILSSDWKLGGLFSGYSSESAFNKVSKMIEGVIEIHRD